MLKWLVRLPLILIALLAAVALAVLVAYRIANYTNGSLISSGERRSYLLYVPKSYDPSAPVPLVISIHGFAQWPAHQAGLTHWNELAEEHGFIAVYPSGTQLPLRWRSGGKADNHNAISPDVTFLADLIDKLEGEYNIDPRRIYVNGMSNGGGMSFALACQMPDRVAAIGLVAAALVYPWDECQPTRPVPAIIFHGDADPVVHFHGGEFQSRPRTPVHMSFPDIPTWAAALAQRNGCGANPVNLPRQGDVSGIQYTGCEADVVFYTVHGGGHAWPGGEKIPEFIVGYTSKDIDATRVMWGFFLQHPVPEK